PSGAELDRPVNGRALTVATGEFDNDGHLDLAVLTLDASVEASRVSVLPGNGDGSFSTDATVFVGTRPYYPIGGPQIAVGDLDGNGRLDIAAANYDSSTISVVLSDGMGRFGANSTFAAGAGPSSVAIGDLDGDGRPDLAVADYSMNGVSVLIGSGAGTFGHPMGFPAGIDPYGWRLAISTPMGIPISRSRTLARTRSRCCSEMEREGSQLDLHSPPGAIPCPWQSAI